MSVAPCFSHETRCAILISNLSAMMSHVACDQVAKLSRVQFFFVRSSCWAKELVDPRTPHFQAYMPADHAHLQHRKHRVQWCNLALWACGYCFTRLFSLIAHFVRQRNQRTTQATFKHCSYAIFAFCFHVERCILNRCCAVTSQFCDIISSARPCSVKTNVLQNVC